MDRKEFIKRSMLGTGILVSSSAVAAVLKNNVDELIPLQMVGFNHLPNEKYHMMENMVLHKADSRGYANHGWLQSYHSFSFANYYNPEKMHFGVLRVLNDDMVAAGQGFGTHPHDNMEIISIPLEGDLEHKDSMGNVAVIRNGDIQVMSAGTGIQHSEYNKSENNPVRFLQIWIFPREKNVEPRYDQLTLKKEDRKNVFQQILSPYPEDEGVWIHQDAWFHLGHFEQGKTVEYALKKAQNGVYIFVLSGSIKVNDQTLDKRDAVGIWDIDKVNLEILSETEVLLMEVPMGLS